MALNLDELAAKYNAGTMTDAELKESGYLKYQVISWAEKLKNGAKSFEMEIPIEVTRPGKFHSSDNKPNNSSHDIKHNNTQEYLK